MCRITFSRLVVILLQISLVAQAGSRYRGLKNEEEDALNKVYARTRAILGEDETAFLEKLLIADELILERQARGIVDQILSTLSGATSNGPIPPGLGVFGTLTGLNATPKPAAAALPQYPPAAAATAPAMAPVATTNGTTQSQSNPIVGGLGGGNDSFLFNQISKVVINSGTGNVTGIVDEALKIGTPAPVRDLVNGILGVAYCNGIRRLLGRC